MIDQLKILRWFSTHDMDLASRLWIDTKWFKWVRPQMVYPQKQMAFLLEITVILGPLGCITMNNHEQ